MILVAYNHRGRPPGGGDGPSPEGAVGAAIYDVHSRGEVILPSADPEANPVLEENMLSDPRDRLRMRDAVRRLAALCAHPALAGLAAAIRLGDSALTPAR